MLTKKIPKEHILYRGQERGRPGPTRAGWGCAIRILSSWSQHFNPPTPCGVGPSATYVLNTSRIFQSTHPVRGGTVGGLVTAQLLGISIHPPRAGWDCPITPKMVLRKYFNPPTPCGVGRLLPSNCTVPFVFQSTHPVRGGTTSNRRRS